MQPCRCPVNVQLPPVSLAVVAVGGDFGSMNSGFAGIDNPLFYADGTTLLFGDAKKSVSAVTEELKAL
jgi:hypothetical protein